MNINHHNHNIHVCNDNTIALNASYDGFDIIGGFALPLFPYCDKFQDYD